MPRKSFLLFPFILMALFYAGRLHGGSIIHADPSNYRALVRDLKPGDTLSLAAGTYPRLAVVGLRGRQDAWITITGPDSGEAANIAGEPGSNTVEILNSSYVAIENLRIDSRGIPDAFGISAKGHEENFTHHIRIEGNTLVGQNNGQQTDGISVRTPTWGWIIRYNQILGAGTGMYLGESDGTQPFVNGLIENNLVKDTIGYNLEIKDQEAIPELPDMPTGPASTIIRNNVFIKNDQPSPDGDRPNVLVSSFPESGPGSLNLYEIYGNYFLHNPREALFQASGRVSLHDNVFVDGPMRYPAVVLRRQNHPLQLAEVYNNTIYTANTGIYFGTRAELYSSVVGNLIFAAVPISGEIAHQAGNVVDSPSHARSYVKVPAFAGSMDFYPLAGQCQGPPLDLSEFYLDTDYSVDFNGAPKAATKGLVVYRGAYAGEASNPGWQLQAGLKAPAPPAPRRPPMVVWLSPDDARAGSTVELTVTGSGFTPDSTLLISGAGLDLSAVKVESATRIVATLKIAPGTSGVRGLLVKNSAGGSNAYSFAIKP